MKILNEAGYEENLYTPNCIRTYTGRYVNVFDPKPEMFCIEDIAHGLSMMPRFGGHLGKWYSVADHCIHASNKASDEYKLTALLHDCSEAYLMDMPKPIKERLQGYNEIEDRLMAMLSGVFGFQYPLPGAVKAIDKELLEWEWSEMMLYEAAWTNGKYAKDLFLEIYNNLIAKAA